MREKHKLQSIPARRSFDLVRLLPDRHPNGREGFELHLQPWQNAHVRNEGATSKGAAEACWPGH